MNEEVLFYFDEINIKSIIRDVFRNCWMILIAGISAILLVSGYRNIIYEAEYTSKATLVAHPLCHRDSSSLWSSE